MNYPQLSSKSLMKQVIQSQKQKQSRKNLVKYFSNQKNPEEHQDQIKSLVKSYLKDKNIQELKQKIYAERLLKRRQKASIQLSKSKNFSKQISEDHTKNTIDYQNLKSNFHLHQHHQNCQKCRQCTCKAHHCQTNKIKFKAKDPNSKFQSNYTRVNRQVKSKSMLQKQRPQNLASNFSSQLQCFPQYSPKLQGLNFDSSYRAEYLSLQPKDKVENYKHLKLSNVKLGLRQIKNYQSSYQHQNQNQDSKKHLLKSPMPFVVKESQNLNNFGLKYNSIGSNYTKEFKIKETRARTPLKPPSLFRDLNLNLVKQSTYDDIHSSRIHEAKSTKKSRSNQDKISIVHHLSSSFIPFDRVIINKQILQSSYKKDYIIRKIDDLKKYACPQGIKSSNGAISKYHD